MYTYRTDIYIDPSVTISSIEQPRLGIDKQYLWAVRECCLDTLINSDSPIVYYVVYRDNDPILYGHLSTYCSFLFNTPMADWWLARWNKDPGEYRKTITLEVLS